MVHNPRYLYASASVSLIIRVVGVGVLFLANIVLARTMPQRDYGLFAYSIELVALASVVVLLGLDQIAIRVVPDALAEGRRITLVRFIASGLIVTLATSFIVMLLLQGARYAGVLPTSFSPNFVILIGISIAALASLRLAQETMRAARKIALSQIVEQIGWPAVLLSIAAVGWLSGRYASVSFLLIAQVTVYAIATCLLFAVFLRIATAAGEHSFAEGTRKWVSAGLPLALAASLSILLNRGDILALGSAVPPFDLAYYTAASRYAALLVLGLAAVSAAGAAAMRDAWRSGDLADLQSTVHRAAGISALFAFPLGAALICFPRLALSLYGPGFVEGATVLRILVVAQMLNAFTGPVALVVIVCDLGKAYTTAMTISTGLLALFLAVLIPRYGTTGAAVATCGALTILNVSLAGLIWHRIGIRTWATPSEIFAVVSDAKGSVWRR